MGSLAFALPLAQVDQEIYDYEDLLAVESSANEVRQQAFPIPILPPPAGFGGDRLTAGGGPAAGENGAYSFR